MGSRKVLSDRHPAAQGGERLQTAARGLLPALAAAPKRFHGTVALDATLVGRDASRIADKVVAHLAGLMGSTVKVTLEIEAEIPSGAPENVVRTVTENSRTLSSQAAALRKSGTALSRTPD